MMQAYVLMWSGFLGFSCGLQLSFLAFFEHVSLLFCFFVLRPTTPFLIPVCLINGGETEEVQ